MKNAWLVLGAILFSCLVFEGVLRAAGISYPILHRLERERGWGPWPGIDGVYSREGGARVRFNRDGMRGPEVTRGKPAGTYRVAVLGDSFTEAREVEEEATFVARIGEHLAGCGPLGGRRIEALNFGVSGYGTAQELITLDSHVLPYEPDLVLLAFYAENDVSNNSRRLDGHTDRPYFVLAGGALVPDRTTMESARFAFKRLWRNAQNAVINHVVLFQFVRDAVNTFRYGLRGKARHEPRFFAPSLGDAAFRPAPDEAWREAWRITERLLEEMNDRVRARGGRFMIAVLSHPAQVHPDPAARQAFKARLGVDSLFYPEDRIAGLGAGIGVPVIAVARPLQEMAGRDRVYFHGFENAVPGDGHYNRDGHVAVGRIIAAGVCAALEADGGPVRTEPLEAQP